MSKRLIALGPLAALVLLAPMAGCESNGGGSASASVGYYGGYHGGYYGAYPGYWYDDDDAVVHPTPGRPARPA